MPAAFIDACALYPTVMREVLCGAARLGAFRPLWTARVIEEWRRAAERNLGREGARIAGVEAELMLAEFPDSMVGAGDESGLTLPDPADIHVLAAAAASRADWLITLNARDFPRRALARFGIERRSPDEVLWLAWSERPDEIGAMLESVRARAEAAAGAPVALRPLLKRAGLPRLARAVSA